jgi:hypothetical protein
LAAPVLIVFFGDGSANNGLSKSSIKALFHETDKYRSSFFRQLFTLFSQIAVKSYKKAVTVAGFYPAATP